MGDVLDIFYDEQWNEKEDIFQFKVQRLMSDSSIVFSIGIYKHSSLLLDWMVGDDSTLYDDKLNILEYYYIIARIATILDAEYDTVRGIINYAKIA